MLKAQAKTNIKSFLVLFPFNEFNRSLFFFSFLTDDYREESGLCSSGRFFQGRQKAKVDPAGMRSRVLHR